MHNILFIIKYKDPSIGGVERVSYELAKLFREHGHNCYLAYYRDKDNEDSDNYFFDEKIKEQDLIAGIISYLKEKDIDIVINQDNCHESIRGLTRYIHDNTDIKQIYCIHNQPDFPKHWKMPLRFRVTEFLYKLRKGYNSYAKPYREIYQNTDGFVMLSQSFIPLAKKCFHLRKGDRLYAIPNPLAEKENNDIPEFENKKKQFLIVSRLFDHQKNIKSALRIWNRFEEYDKEYSLVIVGSGPDESELKSYSEQLGNKRVKFIGHRNDPDYLYRESRFFMMTSRYEGFGLTLIEAQKNGCIPFVYDSYLALHDIVDNGVNGFIIENNNEKQYLHAMQMAIRNSDIESISRNAFSNVKKFDRENIMKRWQTLFDRLDTK